MDTGTRAQNSLQSPAKTISVAFVVRGVLCTKSSVGRGSKILSAGLIAVAAVGEIAPNQRLNNGVVVASQVGVAPRSRTAVTNYKWHQHEAQATQVVPIEMQHKHTWHQDKGWQRYRSEPTNSPIFCVKKWTAGAPQISYKKCDAAGAKKMCDYLARSERIPILSRLISD